MFGRPSRAQLRQDRDRVQAELDAERRAHRMPRAWRVVQWFHSNALLAALFWTVLAAVAVPAVVAGAHWAWWRKPRLTAGTLTVASYPVWAYALIPWWAWLTPAVAYVVGAVWMTLHRQPAPQPPPVLVDEHVARWRLHVAAGDNPPAPGAHVADHTTPIRHPSEPWRTVGRTLHVTGADNTQHAAHFTSSSVRERLAAVYRVDVEAVTVRRVGDGLRCDIDVHDQAYIDEQKRIQRQRIITPHEWAGPAITVTGPDAGKFHVMTAAEDGRAVHGRLWTPGRGVHDIDLSGVKGSGKSNAAMVVLGSVMSAGHVVMDLVDLKGGASLGMWRPAAYRYGTTPQDAVLALDRALAVMYSRLNAMSRMPRLDSSGHPILMDGEPWVGVENVDPSPQWPVYLLVIDEFPRLATYRPAVGKVTELTALARAADVALMVVHQSAMRGEAGWGDLTAARTNITKSGTVAAFRNDSNAGARSVGKGVQLDEIEAGTPGAGFVSSPCEVGEVFGRWPFMSAEAIEAAVRAARPGRLEAAAVEAVEAVESAAREAASPAADAGVVVSAGGGSLPGMDRPLTDVEAGIARYFADRAGQVVRSKDVVTGVPVAPSTWGVVSQRFLSVGLLVSHGRGSWGATAALVGAMGRQEV